MMRRSFAFAILTLLLFVFLSGTAGAEEADPATPTDLDCAHEHVKTTIYFFDSPSYISISSVSHRVSGPAAVETVCLDCGKTLSSETVSNAEEIRPHSMKRGVCALCGYREKARTENPVADMPGERTLFAEQDEKAKGLMTLTLTRTDLSVLNRADIGTVLVRGETGCAVVVLDVAEILSQAEKAGADLYMEMAEQEDGSLFIGLYLVTDSRERLELAADGIMLRFYQEKKENVRFSLALADTDALLDTGSIWDERGYWTVQYLGEGTYFLLR